MRPDTRTAELARVKTMVVRNKPGNSFAIQTFTHQHRANCLIEANVTIVSPNYFAAAKIQY